MFYGRPILPLLRCAAVLLSIPGCDNPTATPPAPPAPAARSAIPTQADGPDVIVHPVGHDAEGYIIRHLQHDGSPDALEQAEASLRPLVGSWPAYGYGQMLLALVRELQGDTTTRSAILGTRSPEEQAAWAFLFRRSPSELELLLRCNQVNSCLAETTPRTFQAALDPFWHIRSGPEVLRCRSWTLPRAQCPAAVEVLGRFAWTARSRDRLGSVNADGPYRGPDDLPRAMGVQPGMQVADIGAGVGFFTFPLARAVGPEGRIHAMELDDTLLEYLRFSADFQGVENISVQRPKPSDLGLPPASLHLAVMCELTGSIFMADDLAGRAHQDGPLPGLLASTAHALRPGGFLYVLDFPEAFALSDDAPATETGLLELAAAAGLAFDTSLDNYQPRYRMIRLRKP